MTLTHSPKLIEFLCDKSIFSFLSTGDIHTMLHDNVQVNRFTGNHLDGSPANIWLRVYCGGEIKYAPLIGISSESFIETSVGSIRYFGNAFGIDYSLSFTAVEGAWKWKAELKGSGEVVDLVYGQDVGLASKGAQLENELYVSQYLGHSIFNTDSGYTVCSRQNIKQDGKNPFLQIGMLDKKATAYCTDATQFYGLSYKITNRPEALSNMLCSSNYQFECTYIALQSEKCTLDKPQNFSFYGYFLPDYKDAIKEPVSLLTINKLLNTDFNGKYSSYNKCEHKPVYSTPYASPAANTELINKLYPDKKLEEYNNGKILSFFDNTHAHIILQEKELLVERPHSNILVTFPSLDKVNNNVITATCNIYGQFNGQTVIGNTSKHKLLSAPRGLLNVMKNSGMRIWIKLCGQYRRLSMPAIFETGLNYCRWHYIINDDVLTVTTFASANSTQITTRLESKSNISYEYIVTAQLVMGTHEFLQNSEITYNKNSAVVRPSCSSPILSAYPQLNYSIHYPENSIVGNDSIFYKDEQSQIGTMLSIQPPVGSSFEITITGALNCENTDKFEAVFQTEKSKYIALFTGLLNNFTLYKNNCEALEVLNETAYWYAHNALIHFIAPHGLEQPGGAAWGTRDICQGPFEFFLATQHFSLLRSILLNIFSHQNGLTGEWPQWFMFDKYPDEMDDCHGDVIFWPLKCVGDYLNATNDYSILQENLSYVHSQNQDTVLQHVLLAISSIEKRFLSGTSLISYAGGDWDDTLQPASDELKSCLVSSWTQALAYQVLQNLCKALKPHCNEISNKCNELAQNMQISFNKYLVIDGIIAGFVYRMPNGEFCPMLHPKDNDTGIHYRLLPMTRSIIANLSQKELAVQSMNIVENILHCPDGVRLMDAPARYSGGVSKWFLRAEQAANVGREISLQYTHAHIRYIEALCRLGRGSKAWSSLFEINPIGLHNAVKNAMPRQRNLYYSSSEGDFYDRYDYAKNFYKLKLGEIKVKGGWRLYSSGPGIYFNQLLSNVLGIRVTHNCLEIDPVLPNILDEMQLTLTVNGILRKFTYYLTSNESGLLTVKQGKQVFTNASSASNYRSGALIITFNELSDESEIDIFAKTDEK